MSGGLTGGNLEEEDKEETGWSQGGCDQGQDVLRLCSRVRNQVVRKPDSPEPPSSRNQGPDIVQGPGNAVVFTLLFWCPRNFGGREHLRLNPQVWTTIGTGAIHLRYVLPVTSNGNQEERDNLEGGGACLSLGKNMITWIDGIWTVWVKSFEI